jgi:drug/metabolite transporter (DMT)-like permease
MTLAGAFCFALVPLWVRSIEAYSPLSIVFYRALIGVVPLFFKGQNYISAQAASVTALFEPVCGIGIGFLFFAEKLTPTGFAGAGIVLLSIYIAQRR